MKKNVIKVLFCALLAGSFVTRAEANPWWWPAKNSDKTADKTADKPADKGSEKTVQIALPVNNGALVSITLPSKTQMKPTRRGAERRRGQDSAADRREDERIAADLERHF
jgi:hypothetical protein